MSLESEIGGSSRTLLDCRRGDKEVQALLAAPEPDDPQDAEVADMYKKNRELFTQTAKFWTESFAQEKAQKAGTDEKVQNLVDMGFPAEAARAALEKHNWDETSALNSLLG